MFHVECTCLTVTGGSTTNGLHRCNRCHGYQIQGIIPESAVCRQCRKLSLNVCAVCFKGVHRIGECTLGHGANSAYSRLPNEKISVCPDCAWQWVTGIFEEPCKDVAEQEAEAKAIMNGHAIETCPRKKPSKRLRNTL